LALRLGLDEPTGKEGHLQSISGCELLNGMAIHLVRANRKSREFRRTEEVNEIEYKQEAVSYSREYSKEDATKNLPEIETLWPQRPIRA
jgi:hypothetical protein